MSKVKNIYRRRRRPTLYVESSNRRRRRQKNVIDGVVCSSEQFSFKMCLESGDGSGTFRSTL